jgi:hypothetical protein
MSAHGTAHTTMRRQKCTIVCYNGSGAPQRRGGRGRRAADAATHARSECRHAPIAGRGSRAATPRRPWQHAQHRRCNYNATIAAGSAAVRRCGQCRAARSATFATRRDGASVDGAAASTRRRRQRQHSRRHTYTPGGSDGSGDASSSSVCSVDAQMPMAELQLRDRAFHVNRDHGCSAARRVFSNGVSKRHVCHRR